MNDLIANVDAIKNELLDGKCETAAKLLAMASLEMQLQNHAISDREFKDYCEALAQPRTGRRKGQPRNGARATRPALASGVVKLNFSGQRHS